ncbi:MAG: hypothetical protein ACRDSF_11070 [Pseudonocardiaceae bacterium]
MSDATRLAELDEQHVELLPARTLLSLLSAIDLGTDGAPGTPGTPGPSIPGPGTWLPIDSQSSIGDTGSAGSSTSG